MPPQAHRQLVGEVEAHPVHLYVQKIVDEHLPPAEDLFDNDFSETGAAKCGFPLRAREVVELHRAEVLVDLEDLRSFPQAERPEEPVAESTLAEHRGRG